MRVLQSGKVIRNGRSTAGRISLHPDTMREIGVELGDYVAIVEDQGHYYIQKVKPDA